MKSFGFNSKGRSADFCPPRPQVVATLERGEERGLVAGHSDGWDLREAVPLQLQKRQNRQSDFAAAAPVRRRTRPTCGGDVVLAMWPEVQQAYRHRVAHVQQHKKPGSPNQIKILPIINAQFFAGLQRAIGYHPLVGGA